MLLYNTVNSKHCVFKIERSCLRVTTTMYGYVEIIIKYYLTQISRNTSTFIIETINLKVCTIRTNIFCNLYEVTLSEHFGFSSNDHVSSIITNLNKIF